MSDTHTETLDHILRNSGFDHTDIADNIAGLTDRAFPGWSQRHIDRTLGQTHGTRCYYCFGFASEYLPVHRSGGYDTAPWVHDGCEVALARQFADELDAAAMEVAA